MRIYKDLELVEHLGSGIPRILEHYGKACFQFTENFLRMVFPASEQVTPQVTPQVAPHDGTSQAPVAEPLGPKSPTQLGPSEAQVEAHEASSNPTSSQQVTQQVRDLLNALNGEMTRLEIMTSLKLKDRVNFTKNYLKPALEKGFIEMTQPNSPNSPTQKYRKAETNWINQIL